MESIKKNQLYILLLLGSFILLHYVIILGKYFFFDNEKVLYNPIDYNVHKSEKLEISDDLEASYVNSSSEMFNVFKTHNFSVKTFLDDSYSNMIVFSSLPDDFLNITPVSARKDLFIKVLLPIVFLENENILKKRKKILQWWTEMDGEIVGKEFWPDWLLEICKEYSFEEENVGNLLMRVDIIPISMALSQAAIESGWGSSRYAREGNAIFGQYTFDTSVGLIPKERESDKKHLIRKFNNLSDSVISYIKNLNTHDAYNSFREQRKKLRMDGDILDGVILSETLTNYSERKDEYIKDVKEIIMKNNFKKFDKVYN